MEVARPCTHCVTCQTQDQPAIQLLNERQSQLEKGEVVCDVEGGEGGRAAAGVGKRPRQQLVFPGAPSVLHDLTRT